MRPRVVWLIITALIFSSGFFIGRYIYPAGEIQYNPLDYVRLDDSGHRQLVFHTFWEAWDQLHRNFIGEIEDKDLFYGAVQGMVRAVDDPYTVFEPPPETKQFEETIQGSFSGIGIEIGVREGAVVVISPLAGSPAELAGVQEGDIIVAVDDEPITGNMGLDDVVQKIRGQKGEPVKITVVRKGADEPLPITVTRDTIAIKSVNLSFDNDIAVIEITNFNGDTAKRFNEAAREVIDRHARGVIVDVRNNPGGFLEAAVEIGSRFIEKGQTIVSERDKDGNSKEYAARGNAVLQDIPTAVIINGGSASASEILAGALLDQRNVPVIGTQSFGKGSVQEFLKLSDGSSLRVTVAKWFTPSGRSINEEGISPTLAVEQDRDTDEDEQLQQAEEELQKIIAGQSG